MDCYGKHYGKRQCQECKLRRYCATAADAPLLNASKESSDFFLEKQIMKNNAKHQNPYTRAERDYRYSRADLMEVIVFMAALDVRTLDLISKRLKEPMLSFNELAKRRGVSRQAVYKAVRQRIMRIPELASVLECRIKNNKGRAGEQCDL